MRRPRGQPGRRARARGDRGPARAQGREPVQDPRVPQRRRRRGHAAASRSPRSTRPALLAAAGHRQGPRRPHPRDLRHGHGRVPPGAARSEFPPTLLDLLRLQGVGPKTVALLYRTLGIATLDALEDARRGGPAAPAEGHGREEGSADPQGDRRAAAARGPPPARRHRRRRRRAARAPAATRARRPSSSRSAACAAAPRPAATSTSWPSAASPRSSTRSSRHPLAERVLGRGETKGSVLLRGGFQADLRLVPAREPRRGAPVLHRLEGAQHRAARPRDRRAAGS